MKQYSILSPQKIEMVNQQQSHDDVLFLFRRDFRCSHFKKINLILW